MRLLANYPFFFDSPEYVELAKLPITEGLQAAHPIAHPVSMVLWRMMYLIFGSSVTALSFVSAIFWITSVVFAAGCVPKERRDMVYLICLFLPLPWVVMTNVGVDSISTSLFVIGIVLLFQRKNLWRVIVATLLFSLAILNYLGMIVWLAIPIMIILSDQKLSWRDRLVWICVVVVSVFLGVTSLFAMGLLKTTVGVGLASVPVAIYHAGVAFIANYTWVSAILVLGFGVSWTIKKEWRKLMWIFGVGTLYVISLLPWHSGPYGRLGILMVFPLAYLYAKLPKWMLLVVITLILPSWLKIVRAYQNIPLPVKQQQMVDSTSCRDKQLVFSEIQRPQLASLYRNVWFVGPVNWQDILVKIEEKEDICISQQALDYPYRQYEGQLPYPLSGKAESKGFLLRALKTEKLQVEIFDSSYPELTIYSVSR